VSKSQAWMFWFNQIEMLNAKGHEFSNDFVFTPGFIAVNCARCEQGFRGRYGKEVGPYDYENGAAMVIRCDNALAINLESQLREEVTK